MKQCANLHCFFRKTKDRILQIELTRKPSNYKLTIMLTVNSLLAGYRNDLMASLLSGDLSLAKKSAQFGVSFTLAYVKGIIESKQ